MIAQSWFDRCWQWQIGGCVAIFGTLCAMGSDRVNAQIVPDNTLGAESSVVTPDVNIRGIPSDQIDGGATRGANLFHSFSDFNVRESRGAYFANPAGIENILTRVTGSNASNILGRLGVLGRANLFLLNPNGIVFGPNASLDIQGSFLATTAGRIQLGNTGYFNATEPQTSSLLSVSPGALFFNAVANQPSSIINRGNLSTGKDITLSAGNLDLQGQLIALGDLTLQAQDTVKVRDTVATPFLARSGGNLTIIGNSGIDILALNHPTQTPFVSGGNLSLISDGVISLDARFSSGGNFSTERLDGSLGNLHSLYDSVILSNGDVILGNYEGASLHVLAGGSVTLSNVTITGTGEAATTINPTNTALFNGSKTYANLATFNLTDYKATLNSDGSVRSVAPVLVPITIDGSTQTTLDVRAGVDWAALGGLPTNQVLPGTPPAAMPQLFAPTANTMAASANITVNGNIRVTQPEGLVLLTNQFSPNTLPGTISIRGNVNTTTGNTGANGGDIRVYGRGDIAVVGSDAQNRISIDSSSYSNSGNAGNGGVISFSTNSGNISLSNSYSYSISFSFSNPNSISGNAGNGGVISFATNSGNISLSNSDSYSISDSISYPNSSSGNAGNGGVISFATNSGNIFLSNSYSYSKSDSYSNPNSSSGNAGNGGVISFATNSGNIFLSDSDSYSYSSSFSNPSNFSYSKSGNAGNGGVISFATNSGNISLSNSSSFSNSKSYSYSNSGSAGNAGNGGVISFATNSGNIFLSNSNSDSSSSSFSKSYSNSGSAGNGGTIHLSARRGTISGSNSVLNSFAVSELGGSGNGGKVTLEAGSGISGLTINTLASGGNSGDVAIDGFGNLLIDQTNILTAQDVEVKLCETCVPTTIPLNNRGQAGNVAVTSTGSLAFSNSAIRSDTRGGNPAGNITITSPGTVSFNNSQIVSNTSSTGQAGSIGIEAGEGITLVGMEDFSPVLSVETSSAGQPGSIIINTPSLTLSNTARITATATNTATNPLGGGSITLNASTMNLAGVVGVFAETQGQTPAGTLTLKPYGNQSTLNLTLAPQSLVSASTNGTGRGGNLIVQAPEAITIRGSGTLAVQTTGTGAAGDLRIDTQRLTIADGATISTSTSSKNPEGTGGNLTINATESFNLTDRSSLRAESTGAAPAGNITINTGKLTANNGTITTSSEQSSGGSINITASNIHLFGNSDITSRVNFGAGGGGNIDLKAGDIIAFDDSDILAFARDGKGGNITLDTPVFFGESYRPVPRSTDPATLNGNNRVDINATGNLASGTITLPDTTFIQNSLTELPDDRINTDSLLASSCIVRRDRSRLGSFTVTGTGGLQERPGDVQMSDFPTVDVETLPSDGTSSNRSWQTGDPIIEPQGVYRLPNGKLVMSRECSINQ